MSDGKPNVWLRGKDGALYQAVFMPHLPRKGEYVCLQYWDLRVLRVEHFRRGPEDSEGWIASVYLDSEGCPLFDRPADPSESPQDERK